MGIRGRVRRGGDRGVTSVEYGLIVAGVAIASLGALAFLRSTLDTAFDKSTTGPGVRACAPGDPNCTVSDVIGTLPGKVIPAPLVPPPAPGNVVLSSATPGPGDGVVTLTWAAATNATRYVATGVPAGSCDVSALTCAISGLAPGVSHSFTVRAYNITTPGTVSNSRSATPTGTALPACTALTTTSATVPKGDPYTNNVFTLNSRTGHTVRSITSVTGDNTSQFSLGTDGAISWQSPNGNNKSVTVTFVFGASGCTDRSGTFTISGT